MCFRWGSWVLCSAEIHLLLSRLRALATNAAGELDVLGRDGHTLGVDSAQVGVLEEANEIRFSGLLCRAKAGMRGRGGRTETRAGSSW